MRYLTLALYAEGPSDHDFLQPVIHRLVTELAYQKAPVAVDIAEQFLRGDPPSGHTRVEKVERCFSKALSSISLLFIHSDAGGSSEDVMNNNVTPCIDRLSALRASSEPEFVGVVPIRETEAWAISDAQAIRNILGVTLSADELGLPKKPLDAEKELDPKSVLSRAQQRAIGRRRRRPPPIHRVLGETVSLVTLRQLNSFRSFEHVVDGALTRLLNPTGAGGI